MMSVNENEEKKTAALEALKKAFPDQHIKIIIGNVSTVGDQKIEILKGINEKSDSWLVLLRLCHDYLDNVCKKPRRVRIVQILLDNQNISFDEIKTIYNYPSGEINQDIISNGSLFEHLNTLVILGYVAKATGRPAKYQIAPQTEIIRKIAAVAKIFLIKNRAEKLNVLETYIKQLESGT